MRKSKRPSAALIIAVVALVAAVGGQSFAAASGAGNAQSAKKHKKHHKKSKGAKGPKGDRGPQGTTGATGPQGSGGALAYAHVNEAGTAVDHAKGIANANLGTGQSGIYCLKGLAFPVNNVQVTLDSTGNLADVAHVTLSPDPAQCGAGAQAEIDISRTTGPTADNHAFFVAVN